LKALSGQVGSSQCNKNVMLWEWYVSGVQGFVCVHKYTTRVHFYVAIKWLLELRMATLSR